jgi:two-component system sensor histidine kinase RstB
MSKWFFGQILLVTILAALLGSTQALTKGVDIWSPYMEKIEQHRGAGIISLLADELNAVTIEEQKALLAQLQAEFGYVLTLKKLATVKLTALQLARVQKGEVVFEQQSLQLIKQLQDNHLVIIIENMEASAKHIPSAYSMGISSSITLLKDLLVRTAEDQWQPLIAKIMVFDGIPVAIKATDELALSAPEKAMLGRSEILYKESQTSADFVFPAEYIYAGIDASNKSIVIGPITPSITEVINKVTRISYTATIFIMLLPLLAWIVPTWRTSGALNRVSQNFAKDDLSGRVKLIFCSNLNTTAKLFNQMADKLDYLLNRNRLLASAISHDLRTPISAMEFSLELLSSSTDQHNRHRHLSQIKTNLQTLHKMSEQLQIYAKFDRQELILNVHMHKLSLWLKKHLDDSWQNVKISMSISTDALQVCCAIDSHYFARAVDNLLSNGLRYAKTVLHITVTRDRHQCFISFENDGQAISPADMQEVFEPFVRLEQSRTKNNEGSGLGLAIVQQITHWHKGNVQVEDSELGGAKFIIQIPIAQDNIEQAK